MASIENIKKLREMTNISISECKKALEEAQDDLNKALKILKERGALIAKKKESRKTKAGLVSAYVHFGGKVGSLVEIGCETDFVSQNEIFKNFAKDIAMQITATSPLYVKKEDVPEQDLQKTLSEGLEEEKFYKENCLLEQEFIKNPSITIKEYLNSVIAKLGENIVVKRFVRFEIGD